MKVLTLDFDGVIADSQYECLVVGFNTYLRFNKNTKLFNGRKLTFDNFDLVREKYKETVDKYKKLRAYVIDAFCYYAILHIIENNIEIKSQNQYNLAREKLMAIYKGYVKYFYNVRSMLQKESFEKWLKLEMPFKTVIDAIKKMENKCIITIATNNRRKSIQPFLNKYKITPKIICDSKVSSDKKIQLAYIKNKLNTDFSQIHFVDDQVRHFPELLKLGVKCYLATWGYNNKEQRKEAKKQGAIFLRQDNFYEKTAMFKYQLTTLE